MPEAYTAKVNINPMNRGFYIALGIGSNSTVILFVKNKKFILLNFTDNAILFEGNLPSNEGFGFESFAVDSLCLHSQVAAPN